MTVTNGRLDRAFDRAHAEGSPKSLARGSGSFKARRNGWPGSLDGCRRKRMLVKIIRESGRSELSWAQWIAALLGHSK
jgi:hypothetical protein